MTPAASGSQPGTAARWGTVVVAVCAGLGALCLGLAPLESRLAGAAWLFLLIAGLAAMVQQRSLGWSLVRPLPCALERPDISAVRASAAIWFLACWFACAVWTGLAWYWNEPCCSRTAEIDRALRLMFAAVATVGLTAWLARTGAQRAALWVWWPAAPFAVCALWVAADQGYNGLRGGALAWSVTNGAVLALLVPLFGSPHAFASRATRWVIAAAALILAASIPWMQVRSAYFVWVWCALLLVVNATHQTQSAQLRTARSLRLGAVGLALLAGLGLWTASQAPGDPLRIQRVPQELKAAWREGDFDSSLGARVAYARMAWNGFQASPWVGVGAQERVRRIRQAGLNLPPEQQWRYEEVRRSAHVHNQYLHHAFDGGLIGLTGILALWGALGLMAWRMRRADRVSAQQLLGLFVVHTVTSLFNVNLAHNYYALMLALCVAWVLLGSTLRLLDEPSPGALTPAASPPPSRQS